MRLPRIFRALVAAAIALCAVQPAFALSERDKAQVEQIIKEYLENNPKVLQEMIDRLQAMNEREAAMQAEKQIVANKDEIFSADTAMIGGNPNGDVTLVEFFDYHCSFCRLAQPDIVKLLKQDPNVRVVFKEYPVLGPQSITASRAAIASAKQGKYVQYHMALMGLQEPLTDAAIYRVAGEVGLDVARLKEDMKSEDIDNVMAANLKLAKKLGIDGTPSFIVGTQLMQGLVPYETLTETIAKARKKPAFKPAQG
jgi:protein-disulfide isomerase